MSTPATLESPIDTAADSIYRRLGDGLGSDLQSRVDAWCERQGLDRLDDPLLVVARQAAFDVLLKATLYEHYHQRGIVPDLDSDPREQFQEAEELTGDPAFGEFVLDDVAWLADREEFDDVLEARHQLLSSDDPAEEIGSLFESLTPQESRRKLGQFRTPATIAELMATWLVRDGTETVLDPGMGACALSAAAYREKRERADEPPLSDVYGVDLNELALVMGATTLTLLDHGEPHNLQVGDFLDLDPGDVDGAVDAVISNPPYSRHHELPEEYKSRINSRAEAELGRDVSALSPMYAYFYYHAAQFLRPGGRMSFVTPSEFLETSYGVSLKQFLAEEFDVTALVLFDRDDDSKFVEAMTTSLVSFLEKPEDGDGNESDPTRIVRVDGDPSEGELLAAITGEVEGETDWGYVDEVRQSDLDPGDKWTRLFDPVDIDTSHLTPLSELATVTRGIATGQNSYFCLTQDEVEEWGIEERYLSKVVRNSRSVPGYDYTGEDWAAECDAGREVWLLYHLTQLDPEVASRVRPGESAGNATLDSCTESNRGDTEMSGLVEYLEHGLSDEVGAHAGYLARNRNPWYVVDRRDPPPILLTYMSRGGSRFVRNETDARNLSNLHGIYLDVEMDEPQLKALLAYLNSEFASQVVRRSGRTYSSGMDKIEPNEMEGVPVLDPRDLDDETVDELAGLFDDLRAAARDAGGTDAVVARIDELLQAIFQSD